MESQLAAAAQKLGNKIRIAKMDSDEESDTSTNLGVGALPTLILFDRSGKQVQRFEGAMMESQIVELVQAAKLWNVPWKSGVVFLVVILGGDNIHSLRLLESIITHF